MLGELVNKSNQIFAGFASTFDGRQEFAQKIRKRGEAAISGLFFHFENVVENALQRGVIILVATFDLKLEAE